MIFFKLFLTCAYKDKNSAENFTNLGENLFKDFIPRSLGTYFFPCLQANIHTYYIIQHKRLTSFRFSEVLITPFDSIYTFVDSVCSNMKKPSNTK